MIISSKIDKRYCGPFILKAYFKKRRTTGLSLIFCNYNVRIFVLDLSSYTLEYFKNINSNKSDKKFELDDLLSVTALDHSEELLTKFPNKCPFGFRFNFVQRELEIFLENLDLFEKFRSALGACLTFKKIPLKKFGFPINVDLYNENQYKINDKCKNPSEENNLNSEINDYSDKGNYKNFKNQKGGISQFQKFFDKSVINQNFGTKQRFSSQTPSSKNATNVNKFFKNNNNNNNNLNYFENNSLKKNIIEKMNNKATEIVFPEKDERMRKNKHPAYSTKLNLIEAKEKSQNLDYQMKMNNYSQYCKSGEFNNFSIKDEKQDLNNPVNKIKHKTQSDFELLKTKINDGENIVDLLNQLDEK